MEAPDCSSPDELHGLLIELFKGHGIAAQAEGMWVTFPGYSGKIQGLIFDRKDSKTSTQVDIRFSPWPGRLICESFAGVADSREERIRESLSIFVENTFHVLLTTFFNVNCGEQINELKLANQGISRTIIEGNVCCRVLGHSDIRLEWVEGFHRILASQSLRQGTHWVRLFFAQLDHKPIALELLLDNEPWTSALDEARSLPWPLNDGYLSNRIFLVIQGGLDVSRAVGILAQNPGADDDELQALLTAVGFSAIDAKRIIVLAPIAFGRRLLKRIPVPTSTVCTLADGVSFKAIDLQSSQLFEELSSISAIALNEGTLSRDEFGAIAWRDASLRAVNELLNKGSKPQDLRLVPPTIVWNEAAPLCSAGSFAPATGNKPWWRFWERSGHHR